MKLAALLVVAGCATQYAYTFQPIAPKPDPDLEAAAQIDAATGVVLLELANHTDDLLQVQWSAITLAGPGAPASLRPDVDPGWLQPGARVSARLFPLALPREGAKAAANEGRQFQLTVPVIARRESKVYQLTLTAHVREL